MRIITRVIFGSTRSLRWRSFVVLFLLMAVLMVLRAEGAMEQHFIYFPDREIVVTPERFGLDFEDLEIISEDGVRLHGWYVPGRQQQPVVLFFHGNAGNISHRIENIAYLNRLGLGVLIFDYRGYGKSDGRADEEGLDRDARAARAWLTQRGIPDERILYFGRSLGAAVAVRLASERAPAGLILETPFTSIRDLGRHHYPLLHFSLGWMIRDRYDALAQIPLVKAPLLVFQGDRDSIVPESMARRLFDAANEPKRFHLIHGADHNDTYEWGGEAYWDAWRGFISSLASARGPVSEAPTPGGGSPPR